tara:strand:- start:181 stop:405 length:225 start_codon:yes stop_codon:yes gene_type:complete
MESTEIIRRIKDNFPDAIVKTNGENCNFSIEVTSDSFQGQSTLQRQKSLMSLFSEDFKSGALHALSILAKTSSE